MCSRIHGPPTSRAMRSASSDVGNSRIRIRCVSSTFATRAASAPALTTSWTASRAASTVSSLTGSRRRRWLTTTCTNPTLQNPVVGLAQPRLKLGRQEILAFRRRVGSLDERMPMGAESLRQAAWAGLQDSIPRAALLALHARVEGVESSTWEHPSLAQLWGPRYSTYVVPKRDFSLFSVGRLPDSADRK